MQAADVIKKDLEYICDNLESELNLLRNKHILITGGAGFLGFYLVNAIHHANKNDQHPIKLSVYDNFIRGVPSWLTNLQNDPYISVQEKDISQAYMRADDQFDFIIHAASIASPTFYRKHPIKTMDTNVNGLRHILDYAVAKQESSKPLQGILYFSSSEIYGDPTPDNIPTPENYFGHVSCVGPRACYDESKRYGETLCVNFHDQYGVPVKIVRPFNNYGPGLKITDRRVIPDFAKNIMNNKDVILFSDGKPKRTFCYVADAVIGYFKALVKGRAGESYNIGVEKPEVSMAELAELMVSTAKSLLNYVGEVKFAVSQDNQYLTDNPQRRCPVISKAKQELGYNPSITLEEGIKRSLIWYKENLHAADA